MSRACVLLLVMAVGCSSRGGGGGDGGGTGGGSAAANASEMRFATIEEFSADLRQKPDVRRVGTSSYAHLPDPAAYLPPGKKHDSAALKIGVSGDPGEVGLWAVTCDSPETARLLVKRLPLVAGSAGHTSGSVVVYGPLDTIEWFRKHYKMNP